MQQTIRECRYWVGVDGGGTKCRAVVFDEQYNELGSGMGGPANVARYGQQALTAIIDAVDNALLAAGLLREQVHNKLIVGAGLAGAYLDSSRTLLDNWPHPFAAFTYSSDLHTALLGAHGGHNGAVMITGTGSCAAVLDDNKVLQLGGYGFLLGDQGSGAWLGQKALQHALLVADGLTEESLLWPAVQTFYNCHTPAQLVDMLNSALPGELARFAPSVFELAGKDPAATAIVTEGAEYLSRLAQRALNDQPVTMVMIGGLAPLWLPLLAAQVQESITKAKQGPEWGAVYLARLNAS